MKSPTLTVSAFAYMAFSFLSGDAASLQTALKQPTCGKASIYTSPEKEGELSKLQAGISYIHLAGSSGAPMRGGSLGLKQNIEECKDIIYCLF